MEWLGLTGVASITVIAYLIGMAVRVAGVDRRWIPVICGVCGGMLGVAALYLMPEFPAADALTAAAVGIVSGLAATGADQVGKQLGRKGARHHG